MVANIFRENLTNSHFPGVAKMKMTQMVDKLAVEILHETDALIKNELEIEYAALVEVLAGN